MTRKTLKIAAWSLAILFLTVILLHLVTGFLMQHRFDAALADLRSHGEPLTLADLAPPSLPDSANAAPLYLHAFQLIQDSPRNSFHRLDALASKIDPLTPDELAEARTLLDQFSVPLDLLRRAASLPDCRFPADYSRPAYALRLPHLAGFPSAARLLVLSSRVQLAAGRPDAALDDCAAGIRLADSLRNEPVLVSLFERIRVHRIISHEVASVLDRSEPSPRALRSLIIALGDTSDRSHFIRALKGERCLGLSLFSTLFGPPLTTRDLHDMGLDSPLFLTRAGVFIFRPLLLADAVNYIHVLNSFDQCAHQPWHLCSARWQSLSHANLADIGKYRLSHPVLSLLLPAISRAGTAFDWDLSVRSAAAQAAALRLYRLQYGQYPDSLSQLVPDFLPKLPPDPFSGKDFVYRKEGSGFLLYSLGANLTDEGGTMSDLDHDTGDLPWKSSH